jgi:arginyl-tRNA synthetase
MENPILVEVYRAGILESFHRGVICVVDENNKDKSMYYIMLSLATKNVLAHGLNVLGINAPDRM